MNDAAILTTLIPGSVWRKEITKGKKTRISDSVVLAISNQTLSESVLELHPQQVVFVTETGKLLTQDIDTFVRNRSFVTINENVAAAMLAALDTAFPEEDDVENFDLVPLTNDGTATVELEAEGTASEESEEVDLGEDAAPNFPFQLKQPHELADVLIDSFVSYTEGPWPTGEVLHALKFNLSDIAVEDLEAVFLKERVPFNLVSWGTLVDLTSAKPMQVGLSIQGSQAYGLVYLLTDQPVTTDMIGEIEISEDEGDVIDVSAKPEIPVAHPVAPVVTTGQVTVVPTAAAIVAPAPVQQVAVVAQPVTQQVLAGNVTIVG